MAAATRANASGSRPSRPSLGPLGRRYQLRVAGEVTGVGASLDIGAAPVSGAQARKSMSKVQLLRADWMVIFPRMSMLSGVDRPRGRRDRADRFSLWCAMLGDAEPPGDRAPSSGTRRQDSGLKEDSHGDSGIGTACV